MLAGRVRLSDEEMTRQASLRKVLRPGLVLEYTRADYHEDESTPVGFHSKGDCVTLVRIVSSGRFDVWLVQGRWGEQTKDAYYLAYMTKEKA